MTNRVGLENAERDAEDIMEAVPDKKTEGVAVYAKLPNGFAIPTPVGNYNPDWAIAFKAGTVKHVYFVAETKGLMSEMQLRKIEEAKIACAGKSFEALEAKDTKFHVTYKQIATYADLLAKVN